MSKFILSLFILFFLGFNSIAQNKYADSINLTALLFSKAIKDYDFEDIVKHTYSKYVTLSGGKDSLFTKLSNKMVFDKQEGLQYKSIVFSKPKKPFLYKKELHCFIPQKTIKENSQGEIIINSFLYAISSNNGISWHFLTDEQFVKNKKVLFPAFNKEIVIPEISSKYIRNKNFSSFNKPK